MVSKDVEERQVKVTAYYNKFSKFYDYLSPKAYYHKARNRAIEELRLKEGLNILNVPVGTGQNFEYFQSYLENTGLIVGTDISPGMLSKAKLKIKNNHWQNIELLNCDVSEITERLRNNNKPTEYSAILCDLGLSGFPDWENVIDSLVSMLSTEGRISIMDWYIEKPTLRGNFVKWIGKGEVDRPIWQYLETQVDDFSVDSSFNRGVVFVASGTKRGKIT